MASDRWRVACGKRFTFDAHLVRDARDPFGVAGVQGVAYVRERLRGSTK